jgi:serine/threonine-protein kinase
VIAPPASPPPAPRAPEVEHLLGRTLGSYRVLSMLGRGGMGQVYLAEHIKLGRRMALKLLRPEYAVKRDSVARFFQEAKAVSRIRHKNIVDVTDFVEEADGTTFIVMELLEGMTLGDKFRRKLEIGRREGLELALQVCEGLEAAHREGIIHRDLKPDNIFLCAGGGDGSVKLLDFGVAKLMGESDSGWQTVQGSVVGTPAYMSPEQAAGIAIDHRADIYSIGTILYELFTGRRVFEAKSFGEYVIKHMSQEPVAPRELAGVPRLPPDLEAAIMRCLQKRPDDRFQSGAELRIALLSVLSALETGSVAGDVTGASRRRRLYMTFSMSAAGVAAVLAFILTWRGAMAHDPVAGPPMPAALAAATREPPIAPIAPPAETGPAAAALPAPAGAPTPSAQGGRLGVQVEQLRTPTPTRVVLSFHSQPEGAEVLDPRSALLGHTPLSSEFPADGATREFTMRKAGFRDQRVRAVCDRDRAVPAVLERVATQTLAKHRTAERGRPETATHSSHRKLDEHVTVNPFKDP